MKPFPNRTSAFKRIRLSLTSELFSCIKRSNDYPMGILVTVVLRLVNGVTVSLDVHYAIDYYNHSVPAAISHSANLSRRKSQPGSGVAHLTIYPPTLGLLPIPYLGTPSFETYPRV